MGRGASKAAGNVWHDARIEAAKRNEKLGSRFGAAELAGMSEDAIKNTELGLEKHMPVEKAVILADLYGRPDLLNYYCIHECPIGVMHPLSDEVLPLEQVTLKLLSKLRLCQLDEVKNKLVDIAEDGQITDYEMKDLKDVLEYFEQVSRTISELKIIGEMIMIRKEKQ